MIYSWDCLSLSQAVEWAATGSRWKHLYHGNFGFISCVPLQRSSLFMSMVKPKSIDIPDAVSDCLNWRIWSIEQNVLGLFLVKKMLWNKFKSECHFLASNNRFRAKDEANQNVSLSQFPLMSVQPHILYVVIDWELGHMVQQQSAKAPHQQRQRACGGPQGFKYRCCCKETPNTEARILHTHVQNTYTILFLR